MKFFNYLLSFVLFFSAFNLPAQEYYDIKFSVKNYREKCQECVNLINNKPKEIQYVIKKDEYDNLYFIVTRKEWFDKIVKSNKDGIAVDIVSKNRYDCSKKKLDKSSVIKGELQKPIYKKELIRNMVVSQFGEVIIRIGTLPDKFKNEEPEFNVLFLKKKYLCHYNNFIDVKSYRWDLLDMGFYFDSLTYKSSLDTTLTSREKYILQNKVVKFEIPFEKNKTEYSLSDIKPLYDSLSLYDYNISKITIRAYSSVEGGEERNIQLQKGRAQSIITALQTFQKPSIITEITISENWVDFLNDVLLTKYAYLADLEKNEIKEKLKNKIISNELEPYLQMHRKAVIVLDVQKKNNFENATEKELMEMFSKSISEKNLLQAVDIQNSIFAKVRNHEVPADIIEKLEVPKKSEFGLLLNKNSMFKYIMNEHEIYNTYKELNELLDLMPDDGQIRYNICTLKFKVWLLGKSAVNSSDFKREILELRKYNIPEKLINRMLVNYEIVMCEYYMIQGDFVSKDKSLKYIYTNYKNLPLSDSDYLSLSQYFSSYAKYDWATKILEKKVTSVDVDEELLFYYLNLTLMDEKLTKRAEYRSIMLNAYNINSIKFCDIFKPYGYGGISFQLLENDYLRKTYCEVCN
jgi:translation elongation factor EF-Ts